MQHMLERIRRISSQNNIAPPAMPPQIKFTSLAPTGSPRSYFGGIRTHAPVMLSSVALQCGPFGEYVNGNHAQIHAMIAPMNATTANTWNI